MIPALFIFVLCPWLLIWGGVRLVREILAYRENQKPAETWPERRARVALENRCDELARRHFSLWNQLNNGDLKP
jgi:hypothetical protein